MWEIIRAGGGFMWPIILCSVVAVAIILAVIFLGEKVKTQEAIGAGLIVLGVVVMVVKF